tara:strand:+ start:49 stop:447 length:399 start_codon:yes stop_codon:yes gene_type:complete
MKKIFILLASMFLLTGCIESVVTIGGGASNGKLMQSSLQSAASFGVKKATGKTPFGHIVNHVKKDRNLDKKNSCSSFSGKKDLEICLMVEKRIISNQAKIKEEESYNSALKKHTSSLQSFINEKSKIKYLDQ